MTYPVGGFFLSTIEGATGWWVGVGQAVAGAPSRYSHGGIIISATGVVLEARPGGARLSHLDRYAGRPLLISDAPIRRAVAAGGDEQTLRAMVVCHALNLRGTPYSWLDYLALTLLHLGLPSEWVRRRVERSGRLTCGQLIDLVLRRAGIHLWHDDRLPGDVMPSDLAAWAEDADRQETSA